MKYYATLYAVLVWIASLLHSYIILIRLLHITWKYNKKNITWKFTSVISFLRLKIILLHLNTNDLKLKYRIISILYNAQLEFCCDDRKFWDVLLYSFSDTIIKRITEFSRYIKRLKLTPNYFKLKPGLRLVVTVSLRDRSLFMVWGWHRREMFFVAKILLTQTLKRQKFNYPTSNIN